MPGAGPGTPREWGQEPQSRWEGGASGDEKGGRRAVRRRAASGGARRVESPVMNAREWITAFAERLGVEPPTRRGWSTLRGLSGGAGHAAGRVAAPVCWWVAARAGVDPEPAVEVA